MKERKAEQFQFQQTPGLPVSPYLGNIRKTRMFNPRLGKAHESQKNQRLSSFTPSSFIKIYQAVMKSLSYIGQLDFQTKRVKKFPLILV